MNQERTGWRDEKLSREHREWGYDLPMTDIDFLMVECNKYMPSALIEYKNEHSNFLNFNSWQYVVLKNFSSCASVPFFVVVYSDDLNWYEVIPMNEEAKVYIKDKIKYTKEDYQKLLRKLRDF